MKINNRSKVAMENRLANGLVIFYLYFINNLVGTLIKN
jgi:hypothetical protein